MVFYFIKTSPRTSYPFGGGGGWGGRDLYIKYNNKYGTVPVPYLIFSPFCGSDPYPFGT